MPGVLLGEFLIEKGFITKQHLEEALQTQRVFAGKKLGELLVDGGFLTREVLEQALAMQQTLRGQVRESAPQEKAGFLGKVPLLKELSAEELDELTALTRVETFPRGHLIFVESEDGEAAYFLITGSVRLVKSSPTGGEEEMGTAGDGDVFGEAEMLYTGQRALTAYVQMDSTAVVLGKKEFDGLLERNPVLGIKLFRLFGGSVALRLRDSLTKHVEDAVHVRSSKGFI